MINTHLVLVSLSVYTFDVSNTTFENKDMVSMRILGHGTLVVGRDAGARGFPDRRTHGVATRPKPQPYV